MFHRVVGKCRTWELLSTPSAPAIVQIQIVTSLSMYSSGRIETRRFEQVSCALTPTFSFTKVGIMPLRIDKHLISRFSGAATFPLRSIDGHKWESCFSRDIFLSSCPFSVLDGRKWVPIFTLVIYFSIVARFRF